MSYTEWNRFELSTASFPSKPSLSFSLLTHSLCPLSDLIRKPKPTKYFQVLPCPIPFEFNDFASQIAIFRTGSWVSPDPYIRTIIHAGDDTVDEEGEEEEYDDESCVVVRWECPKPSDEMSKTGDEEDEDEWFYESLDRIVSSSCSCSTSNSDSDQEPDDDGRGGGELQAVGEWLTSCYRRERTPRRRR
ncbi:hypothetical protein TIFTF001_018582 [Ficus carica]|uniref:Uncharacterized protein n=1 Tax=Ficus carica TaxID=3494 RepID=A0AA88D9E0_FICCA|nr:hypothetical protein TIFTF001_018582 [Ficus carica]